jgi:hypothetical protein
MEEVLYKQILPALSCLIPDEQFAYLPGRDTTLQLLRFTEVQWASLWHGLDNRTRWTTHVEKPVREASYNHSGSMKTSLLSASYWFLAYLALGTWRWGRYVPPKVYWLPKDYTVLCSRRHKSKSAYELRLVSLHYPLLSHTLREIWPIRYTVTVCKQKSYRRESLASWFLHRSVCRDVISAYLSGKWRDAQTEGDREIQT